MEYLHLFSKTKITSIILYNLLEEMNLCFLGHWEENELETIYKKQLNEVKLNNSKNGISYTISHYSRELLLLIYKNSNNNYEIIISLNSLDLDKRILIVSEMKSFFLKQNKFDILLHDHNDTSHTETFNNIYSLKVNDLPKSVDYYIKK